MKASRWAKWLLLILASLTVLLAATALTVKYLLPYLQRRSVARLNREFNANPCQQTADPLVALLIEKKITEEAGGRILEALFLSRVTAKESYGVGEPIVLDIAPAHPLPMFPVEIPEVKGTCTVHVEGIMGYRGYDISESLTRIVAVTRPDLTIPPWAGYATVEGGVPKGFGMPLVSTEPGIYRGHVRILYRLFFYPDPPPSSPIMADILDFFGLVDWEFTRLRVFRSQREIPITIRIVDRAPSDRPTAAGTTRRGANSRPAAQRMPRFPVTAAQKAP